MRSVVMSMIKSSLTTTRRGSDNPANRNYLYSLRIQGYVADLSCCAKVWSVLRDNGGEDAEVDDGDPVGWAGLAALPG